MPVDLGSAVLKLTADATALNKTLNNTEAVVNKFGAKLGKTLDAVGKGLTARVTLPMVALGVGALKMSVDFETAFAGVRKTVDATEAEFEILSAGFREMATELPITAIELANIGEIAGQLGVTGVNNISEFTRTMAMMSVTTALTADEAATQMARFANIMGTPISEMDRLGSVIVDLGNNLATTEPEILGFGLRIAGAGKQVGLSEAQIMSLGAALSSVGINVESGGTAISRTFVTIASAVANGGQELSNFATVADMSSAQFGSLFSQDATAGLLAFISGLDRVSKSGENVFAVLDELGLGEIRVRDALLRTAGASDLLSNALDIGENAWQDNTALVEEAEKRFETVQSKIEVLRNNLTEMGIVVGDVLLPRLSTLVQGLTTFVQKLQDVNPETINLALAIAGIAAVAGPLLMVLGSLVSVITAIGWPILALVGVVGALASGFVILKTRADETKEANTQLSAKILETSDSYETYKIKMGNAGLVVDTLTRDVYDLVKAHQDQLGAIKAIEYAKQVQGWKAQMDVLKFSIKEVDTGLAGLDAANKKYNKTIESQIDVLKDQVKQFALSNDEFAYMAASMGLFTEEEVRQIEAQKKLIAEQELAVKQHEQLKNAIVETAKVTEELTAVTADSGEEMVDIWASLLEELNDITAEYGSAEEEQVMGMLDNISAEYTDHGLTILGLQQQRESDLLRLQEEEAGIRAQLEKAHDAAGLLQLQTTSAAKYAAIYAYYDNRIIAEQIAQQVLLDTAKLYLKTTLDMIIAQLKVQFNSYVANMKAMVKAGTSSWGAIGSAAMMAAEAQRQAAENVKDMAALRAVGQQVKAAYDSIESSANAAIDGAAATYSQWQAANSDLGDSFKDLADGSAAIGEKSAGTGTKIKREIVDPIAEAAKAAEKLGKMVAGAIELFDELSDRGGPKAGWIDALDVLTDSLVIAIRRMSEAAETLNAEGFFAADKDGNGP